MLVVNGGSVEVKESHEVRVLSVNISKDLDRSSESHSHWLCLYKVFALFGDGIDVFFAELELGVGGLVPILGFEQSFDEHVAELVFFLHLVGFIVYYYFVRAVLADVVCLLSGGLLAGMGNGLGAHHDSTDSGLASVGDVRSHRLCWDLVVLKYLIALEQLVGVNSKNQIRRDIWCFMFKAAMDENVTFIGPAGMSKPLHRRELHSFRSLGVVHFHRDHFSHIIGPPSEHCHHVPNEQCRVLVSWRGHMTSWFARSLDSVSSSIPMSPEPPSILQGGLVSSSSSEGHHHPRRTSCLAKCSAVVYSGGRDVSDDF